jgi:hypothetical protein
MNSLDHDSSECLCIELKEFKPYTIEITAPSNQCISTTIELSSYLTNCGLCPRFFYSGPALVTSIAVSESDIVCRLPKILDYLPMSASQAYRIVITHSFFYS